MRQWPVSCCSASLDCCLVGAHVAGACLACPHSTRCNGCIRAILAMWRPRSAGGTSRTGSCCRWWCARDWGHGSPAAPQHHTSPTCWSTNMQQAPCPPGAVVVVALVAASASPSFVVAATPAPVWLAGKVVRAAPTPGPTDEFHAAMHPTGNCRPGAGRPLVDGHWGARGTCLDSSCRGSLPHSGVAPCLVAVAPRKDRICCRCHCAPPFRDLCRQGVAWRGRCVCRVRAWVCNWK